MAKSQDIWYRTGSDNTITIEVNGLDLADGGGVKTVTMNLIDTTTPTSIDLILSGITVTATGDPSTVTVTPNSAMKALTAGTYTYELAATDSSSNVEYTERGKFFIEGL